jgi:hypothetical protein
MNKLSYSQINKFMFCPESYRLHYKEKVRDNRIHSALLFGSAVGKAVEELLKTNSLEASIDMFCDNWLMQTIDDVPTYLMDCTRLVYANSDYDPDLINEADWTYMEQELSILNPQVEVEKIYSEKDYIGWNFLPEDRKKILNTANWFSLRSKGIAMIKSFNEQIMPRIEHVYGTEIEVSLDNGQGDSIVGFADFVVKFQGYDKPIILDLKTSAREYDKDAVVTSPQLSLYLHSLSDRFEGTRLAGYVVLRKAIRKNKIKVCSICGHDGSGKSHKTCPNEINGKRCGGEWNITVDPKAEIQLMIDEIPQRTEEIVLDNFDYINTSIKNGVYHRNFSACIDSKRGKCPYYELCYRNSYDGLFKKE